MKIDTINQMRVANLFILSLFLFACAQGKPHSEGGPGGETDGSDVTTTGESAAPPSMFPHLTNWEEPASHGGWVVQYGYEPCLKCHKQISVKQESLPTCNNCHPLYPHTSDWVQKERHGGAVLNKGSGVCATQCHGTGLQGGLSKISCTRCHTTYPHPDNWALPGEHGDAGKKDGKMLCQICHGTDFEGGDTGVSCKDCHEGYPHETGWGSGEVHGKFVLEEGKASCQTSCHGLDLKGGLTGIACDGCHKMYPHVEDWKDKHGVKALELGKDECTGCHGEGFKKMVGGKNCYSCHPDYPHPDETSWLPYEGGHGEAIKKTYGGDTTSCEMCHGDDLKTIKQEKNCFSCHPPYPHQGIASNWKNYEGHGEYTLKHSKTECSLCHGADYQGGSRGNPSCYKCHVSYPHVAGWFQPDAESQGHAEYVGDNTSASCATAGCHGIDLVVQGGVSQGPSCGGCHETYPHEEGWKSGTIHGPVAMANIKPCKGCHEAGLDKAPQGYQSCKECHASYLQHKTAQLGGDGWGTEVGHAKVIADNPVTKKKEIKECQLCHGSDYSGGVSNKSCKESSCHAAYPHLPLQDGTKWLNTAGQPQGHGKYLPMSTDGKKKDATQCQACHGIDYATVVGVNSCKGCHANYPHTLNWGDPTQHGVFVLKDLKNNKTTCQKCHGDNLQGGISGKSCFGCHAVPMTHEAGWGDPLKHGMYVLKDLKKDKTSCKLCHGDQLDGGAAQKSCFGGGCHEGTITHADGSWQNPAQHGNYLLTKLGGDKGTCQKCHSTGEDWSAGGVSGKSCQGCHPSYPHKADWKNPTKHGIFVLTDLKNDKTLCNQCHSGPKQVSCAGAGCHTSPTTHNSGWKGPTQHGMYVLKDLKNDKTSCKVCHGDQLNGGAAQKSCFGGGCHEGTITHSDQNWKQPSQHGQYLLVNLGNNKAVCQQCHATGGDWSTGGVSGKSCQQCHAAYPHTDGAQAKWLDQPSKPQGHGNYLLENPADQKQKLTGCQNCHGVNYDKLINGKSCRTCHNSYPHTLAINNLKWFENAVQPQGHGDYVLLPPADQQKKLLSCQGCHGPNYDTVLSGKSCKGCHANYPHTLNWGDPTQHGVFVLKDLANDKSACKLCHGDNLQGGISGKSCFGCHAVPMTHEAGWGDPVKHGIYVLKDLKKDKTSCKLCHGDQLDGGAAQKSCFGVACHTVPMTHENGWKDPSQHGIYVLTTLSNDKSSCQKCHGDNLQGGITGVNCYQAGCHTAAFTHQGDQWKDPSQHGLVVIQTLNKDVSSCKICHGAAFNLLAKGKNCYDCHENYPHKEFKADWDKTPHGQAALTKEGRDKCKKCHGDDLKGGLSGISCWKCHANFPHIGTWTETTSEEVNPCEADGEPDCWETITHLSSHAVDFITQKEQGFLPQTYNTCSSCHGQNYDGGNSKVSCGPLCHDKNIPSHVNYPHLVVPNWNPDGQPNPNTPLNAAHGKTYLAGKPGMESSCSFCHTNLNSGPDGKAPSCYTCHYTYPHPAGWNKGATHGYKLYKNKKIAECKACHGKGLDYNSVSGGKTCKDCHPAYLPHNTAGLGTGNWQDPPLNGNHGSYYLDPANGGEVACKMCHGKPELTLQFTPTDTQSSLMKQSYCHTCHRTYPHNKGYDGNPSMKSGHTDFVNAVPDFLVTANGTKPNDAQDPIAVDAVKNTCGGGTAGACHFDGLKSPLKKNLAAFPLCGGYCHKK